MISKKKALRKATSTARYLQKDKTTIKSSTEPINTTTNPSTSNQQTVTAILTTTSSKYKSNSARTKAKTTALFNRTITTTAMMFKRKTIRKAKPTAKYLEKENKILEPLKDLLQPRNQISSSKMFLKTKPIFTTTPTTPSKCNLTSNYVAIVAGSFGFIFLLLLLVFWWQRYKQKGFRKSGAKKQSKFAAFQPSKSVSLPNDDFIESDIL